MKYCQKPAQKVLASGGIFTERGRTELLKMDKDFIERYVSPGGCPSVIRSPFTLLFT